MDAVSALETALGAELLRADMLGAPRPRIAGRYVVQTFLGRGATGLVVAAFDETLARKVALKLTPVGASAAIADEARALARLSHRNVVRVFDAIASDVALDGKSFRVWAVSMQLVPGTTFRAWLRERKRTTADVVRVLLEAGAGLAAAHAARIVHRDFKPENVLVDADGVAQVIDFGLAVPQPSSGGVTAEIAGTAPYLAPEARQGQVGPRSDQYAFGITLVEALTGDTTPPPLAAPEGVDPRVWSVAVRATHPDARRRFEDMNALLTALRSAARPRWGCGTYSLVALVVSCLACVASGPIFESYEDYRCARFAGRTPFVAQVSHSTYPGVDVGDQTTYALILTHRDYCVFDVVIERDGAADRAHEQVQGAVVPWFGLVLDIPPDHDHPRHYRFRLRRPGLAEGYFDATTTRGSFRGRITHGP